MGKCMFMRKGHTHTKPIALPAVGTALNDCSWEQIRLISDEGLSANYFSVGDRKAVELSGTAGSLALSGTYYCFIIGIDHNESNEGKGIHFQFGFSALSGGARIAFVDSGYGSDKTSGSWFNINNSSSNTGGWNSSLMRSTIIPAFKACLPSGLQAVLKTVTKYTDNTGGGSNTASYVTATEEDIFLLAEFEVKGSRAYANSAEQNYQERYDYYAAGNSMINYKHNATSTASAWWLRSVRSGAAGYFVYIDASGTLTYDGANCSYGLAPAFCV